MVRWSRKACGLNVAGACKKWATDFLVKAEARYADYLPCRAFESLEKAVQRAPFFFHPLNAKGTTAHGRLLTHDFLLLWLMYSVQRQSYRRIRPYAEGDHFPDRAIVAGSASLSANARMEWMASFCCANVGTRGPGFHSMASWMSSPALHSHDQDATGQEEFNRDELAPA